MGRSVWHFQPPQPSLSDEEEQLFLQQLSEAFVFHKKQNPNSADQVFRKAQPQPSASANDPLNKALSFYQTLQTTDGNWPGDYGGPMFLLPGLVIASYITDTPFPAAHRTLMLRYMRNHQRADGGWGLHLEGNSTMFGTVLQYVAMRILGAEADEESCVKARNWIQSHGSATATPSWGKFYLCVLGVFDWEGVNSLFPEMWLLPKWLPVHPSRYWCHTRMVYLPMSYCYGHRFSKELTPLTTAIRSEIFNQPYDTINWKKVRNECAPSDNYFPQSPVLKAMNAALNQYEKMHAVSFRKKALDFIIDYIHAEDEQTNYINIGPVNQAINSIAVFHACGKNSPEFQKHVKRWYDYLWVAEDGMKMQGYNGSQFWDTAFALQAVWESGLEASFPVMEQRASQFCTAMQLREEVKDREKYFRHKQKGGFPFSNVEHGWPITDCSAEGLKVLLGAEQRGLQFERERFTEGCDVLLSYQNKDGGWASYENTRAPHWLEKLNPAELFGNIMIDYSYVECSSACMQALLKFHHRFPDYRAAEVRDAVERGIRFILNEQREDGSWYGSWAVCFTYGSWFAAEVLSSYINSSFAVNAAGAKKALEKMRTFLLQRQMDDGGWGESFESCVQKKYIASEQSQIVNTSWAVMSLLLLPQNGETTKAIERALALIYSRQLPNGDFPQENISGVFNHNCMITYTSYRNVFPIWALGRARRAAEPKPED